MNATVTLTTFNPGEAERITGVSTVQQRDWRRRGYLPANEGHARFDAFSLGELWALKLLADRGIGPQQSKDVIDFCGRGMAWFGLESVDAYEGDHHRVFEWQPDLYAQLKANTAANQEAIKLWVTRFESGAAPRDVQLELRQGPSWGDQAGWLRRRIFTDRGFPRLIPSRFFIWWADGSHVFHHSLEVAFNKKLSGEEAVAGAVLILDLEALGSALSERAQRPLAHVELTSE
jgi:hypothetical protein